MISEKNKINIYRISSVTTTLSVAQLNKDVDCQEVAQDLCSAKIGIPLFVVPYDRVLERFPKRPARISCCRAVFAIVHENVRGGHF